MPWDIVRLPCGSMSMHRTRWPFSAKATATLSVVVVLATPPFWLANAMTLALVTAGSNARWGNPCAVDIRKAARDSFPPVCYARAGRNLRRVVAARVIEGNDRASLKDLVDFELAYGVPDRR